VINKSRIPQMIKKVPLHLNGHLPWGLTVLAWSSYLLWIIVGHNQGESPFTILSTLPVLVTAWYFGLTGSVLAIFGVLTISSLILSFLYGYPLLSTFSDPALLIAYQESKTLLTDKDGNLYLCEFCYTEILNSEID